MEATKQKIKWHLHAESILEQTLVENRPRCIHNWLFTFCPFVFTLWNTLHRIKMRPLPSLSFIPMLFCLIVHGEPSIRVLLCFHFGFVSVQSLRISRGRRSAVLAREQRPPFSSSAFCKYSEESWAHATYSCVEKSYKTVPVRSGKGQMSARVCLLLVVIEVHQLKINKEERLKYCVTVSIWEKDKKQNKNVLKINVFFSRWFIHKRLTSVIYKAPLSHHCWQKHSSRFLQEVPNVKWNMKRATSQSFHSFPSCSVVHLCTCVLCWMQASALFSGSWLMLTPKIPWCSKHNWLGTV